MVDEKASDCYPLFEYCGRQECNNRVAMDENFESRNYDEVKEILKDCTRSCEAYQEAKRGVEVTV